MEILRIFGPLPDHHTTCSASITETLCKSLLFISGVSIAFISSSYNSDFFNEAKYAALTSLLMVFTLVMVHALKTAILQQLEKHQDLNGGHSSGITPALRGKISVYICVVTLLSVLLLTSNNGGESAGYYYFFAIVACLNLSFAFLAMAISLGRSLSPKPSDINIDRALHVIYQVHAYHIEKAQLESKILFLKVIAALAILPVVIFELI